MFCSLQAQSLQDFEWLVVDDGSTDETEALVGRFAERATFDVRYVRQDNQGKHIALNTGVGHARGEFIAVIDSDDWYEAPALERLVTVWRTIDDPSSYAEVQALCADTAGKLIGDRFPCDRWFDADAFDLAYRYRVRGDKIGMHRRAVLREFPFPDQHRRVCVPEALVWFRMAEQYRTRYLNEVLGRKEYLGGGLTDGEDRHAVDWAGPRRDLFRQVSEMRRPMPATERARAYANWSRNARLSGTRLRAEVTHARNPVAFAALAPLGVLLSVRDRRRTRVLARQDQAAVR